MILYSCAITSPRQAVVALTKEGIFQSKEIYVLPVGARIAGSEEIKSQARKAKLLIVLDWRDFEANLGMLNKYPKSVLLFAAAMQLERVSPCIHTDSMPNVANAHESHKFFEFNSLLFTHPPMETADVVITNDFLPKLINNVRDGSLLNGLMTIIYKAGNAQQQKSIRETAMRWLIEDATDTKLLKKMMEKQFEGRTGAASWADKLTAAATVSEDYLKAFRILRERKAKGAAISYSAIKKQFPTVDMFEIRYIVKAHSQITYGRDIAGKTLHEIYFARSRNSEKKNTTIIPAKKKPKATA